MPQFMRAHNAGLMLGKTIMQHNSLAVFVAVTIAAHTPQRKVQYYNCLLYTSKGCYKEYEALGDGDHSVGDIVRRCETLKIRNG